MTTPSEQIREFTLKYLTPMLKNMAEQEQETLKKLFPRQANFTDMILKYP